MVDRYSRGVLTIIAGALIYLCVVLTPWPAAQAQTQKPIRPGDPTGPISVVIVGWRAPESDRVTIAAPTPVPVTLGSATVQVTSKVMTERSSNAAERVVLTGWEERGDLRIAGSFRPLEGEFARRTPQGLPVTVTTPR